jgi:glutamate 5-kinase
MRIVLKFGSGILANPQGNTLDEPQFERLTREVAAQVSAGHECLIVSSGAVAAGLGALGLEERPEDLAARQACAAVGQSKTHAALCDDVRAARDECGAAAPHAWRSG